MSLKFRYILFIGLLHILLVYLSYQALIDRKWIFLGVEFLIFISLYLSYLLYKGFIKPVELMQSGTDAIADADFNIKYLKTGSTEIDKLVNVYNNMIDKLRIERTNMSEQSYFVQNLIEVTPLGIIILDHDGKVSNINPAAKDIIQIDNDILGQYLPNKHSELLDCILQLSIGNPTVLSINGKDKYKCQITEIIHQGFRRKFIIIDNLSREILRSEKDAYGRIIRMMAHEVNNSMGAINSILDTVIEYGFQGQNEDDELKESLEIAKDRNQGLSQFVANYAAILRLPPPQKRKIDLNQLIKKSSQLYYPIAREKGITLQLDQKLNPIYLDADPILLEQAISNILKNAIESIDDTGEIKITCSEFPKGFTISDNGPGIDPENEKNLFTPFYSTKPTGQGVGLMLIRDILNGHKANFTLRTDRKTGWTSFKAIFP